LSVASPLRGVRGTIGEPQSLIHGGTSSTGHATLLRAPIFSQEIRGKAAIGLGGVEGKGLEDTAVPIPGTQVSD